MFITIRKNGHEYALSEALKIESGFVVKGLNR